MTCVKICGIRSVEAALTAVESGASMLGFIMAPGRRQVSPEVARDIVAEVRRFERQTDAPSPVLAVGVFVNEAPRDMNRISKTVGFDYTQLSGDETDDTIDALDVPAIKVIHVANGLAQVDLERRANDSKAQILLFDSGRRGTYGGTGTTFDWSLLPTVNRPVLLAGGLSAQNVSCAIQQVRPWGVDVSSGVESDGQQDVTKIREFIEAATLN